MHHGPGATRVGDKAGCSQLSRHVGHVGEGQPTPHLGAVFQGIECYYRHITLVPWHVEPLCGGPTCRWPNVSDATSSKYEPDGLKSRTPLQTRFEETSHSPSAVLYSLRSPFLWAKLPRCSAKGSTMVFSRISKKCSSSFFRWIAALATPSYSSDSISARRALVLRTATSGHPRVRITGELSSKAFGSISHRFNDLETMYP
jgi:hypothetical protein